MLSSVCLPPLHDTVLMSQHHQSNAEPPYAAAIHKCNVCTNTLSSALLPKLLPCSHVMCDSCIQDSISICSITCPLCKTIHEYASEENGFLVRMDNHITLFDDWDNLININEQYKMTICDIVTEHCTKVITLIGNLFKNISTDTMRVRKGEFVNKSVLIKEFPFHLPNKSHPVSKIDEDLLSSFEKSLEPFNLLLKHRNVEVNNHERANENIILETKSKQYTIDMGKNIDSICSLFNLLEQSEQSSSSRSTEDNSSHKSNEEDTVNKKSHEEPLVLIHDTIEHVRRLKQSIRTNKPYECTDDLPEKLAFIQSEDGAIFNPLQLIKDRYNDTGIQLIPPKLISTDALFEKSDIIDGNYCRKFENTNGYYNFRYPCFDCCYECAKNCNFEDMNGNVKKEFLCMYYIPKYSIGLCVVHAFEYKIRYGYLRMISIQNKDDMKNKIGKHYMDLKNLLVLLLKTQYSRKLDNEELTTKKNQ